MALPAILLSPLALKLLTIGAASAAASWAASRKEGPERIDIQTEDALERLRDGGDLRVDRTNGRADAEARLRRTLRLGRNGPGVEIDLAGLARLRMRRAPPRG